MGQSAAQHESPPANRPRLTRRGAQKRTRILDAAARVLAQRGYAGTTLAEIAEQAGTQAGSLYYHFESREDLIEAVLRGGVKSASANTRGCIDSLPLDATPGQKLAAAIKGHVRFQLAISDYAKAAVRSIGQVPQDMWERVNTEFRAYGRLFDGLIVACIEAGDIDPSVDRKALRMMILGAANWTPEWYRESGTSNIDEIAELLVRLVFRGVGVR